MSLIKREPKKIFFNASVILAGLNSPRGGSAKVITWCKKGKLNGVVSEIIIQEVLRNAHRIDFSEEAVGLHIGKIFTVVLSPSEDLVNKYTEVVLDAGDAHVLASAKQIKADFLVTLDQKHLLVLKDQIKEFKIVTPGELIDILK